MYYRVQMYATAEVTSALESVTNKLERPFPQIPLEVKS